MKYRIDNLEEFNNFAKVFAKAIKPRDVISLKGDLGAGKTTFVQFIGKHLGIDEYITSPTFSIINIYNGDITIYHLDLYRLEEPSELEALDFENYFYPEDEITFIEWAEKADYYLPDDLIEIEINISKNGRILEIVTDTKRSLEIGEYLDENFINWHINNDDFNNNYGR